jgi:methionyl-tRNA synthetase
MIQKQKTFYITTTLPYVNGSLHTGHAMEFIRADVLARHKRILLGDENVFFNTGTDEHGQKIFNKAKEEGISAQEYTDRMSGGVLAMTNKMDISYDKFIRTTDKKHMESAQKFWKLVEKKGYIEKRRYEVKYCVGCELEKTDSELVDGFCPDHLDQELENINEENYFFLSSNFTKDLKQYYEKNPIIPKFRQNEIENLVNEKGMKDFSISRLKEKMEWGIPVPGDETQVMYVWFDALVNYISTLGWGGEDQSNFKKFWEEQDSTVFQICGKDNIRPQAAMWQSMLFAAGIKNTDVIYINGHITAEGGVKMSKSMGNTIDPDEFIEKYGVDAMRYFVVRHVNNHEDSAWTEERFWEGYNADLVNGLGNLTNRILAMSQKAEVKLFDEGRGYPIFGRENSLLEKYNFNGEAEEIWRSIGDLDELITKTAPFKLAKSDDPEDKKRLKVVLLSLLNGLWAVADWVYPIMPDASEKIKKAISENKKPEYPIFPRIEK